jgi:hypothetical protein
VRDFGGPLSSSVLHYFIVHSRIFRNVPPVLFLLPYCYGTHARTPRLRYTMSGDARMRGDEGTPQRESHF